MSTDPSYPKEAAVGDKPQPVNETLAAAVTAKESGNNAETSRGAKASFVRGAAVGVGSAALVAALLYANRSRKDKA